MVSLMRRRKKTPADLEVVQTTVVPVTAAVEQVEIPAEDPFHTYLVTMGAPVEIKELELASPTLQRLRELGVEVVIPLVGQGELLGALYLGGRLSDQPYSTDDRKLLGNLASQVAPAMQVAQLVREQQIEAKERE